MARDIDDEEDEDEDEDDHEHDHEDEDDEDEHDNEDARTPTRPHADTPTRFPRPSGEKPWLPNSSSAKYHDTGTDYAWVRDFGIGDLE
jgi:hypothetical protein